MKGSILLESEDPPHHGFLDTVFCRCPTYDPTYENHTKNTNLLDLTLD